jgi:hypothetical protein
MSTLLHEATAVIESDAAADLLEGYSNYTTVTELTLAVGEGYEELVGKSISTATPIITTTTLIFGCGRS